MLIKNAKISGYDSLQDIEVLGENIIAITPSKKCNSQEQVQGEVYDISGAMVIPPYCEPHIHLDGKRLQNCT